MCFEIHTVPRNPHRQFRSRVLAVGISSKLVPGLDLHQTQFLVCRRAGGCASGRLQLPAVAAALPLSAPAGSAPAVPEQHVAWPADKLHQEEAAITAWSHRYAKWGRARYKRTASAGPYLEVHDILVHLGMRIPLGFLKGSQLPSLARQLPFASHQLPFQLGHPTLQPPLLACQALQYRDKTSGYVTGESTEKLRRSATNPPAKSCLMEDVQQLFYKHYLKTGLELSLHAVQLLLRSCQLLPAGGQAATQAVQLIGLVYDLPLKAVVLAASSVEKALELPDIVLQHGRGSIGASALHSMPESR
ncbi:MAG: hypothetical protein FRX49_12220 [Trebouxia sp. A1-2]|nr:MAG: hypothetical protein FRX49_12220 [Trebouxia sp. A1-2]